jgi:hypothetical protein
MQTKYTVALSLVVGFALGAAAIQTLRAQAKAIGYVVAEVNVKDQDGYKKDFLPVIVPSSKPKVETTLRRAERQSLS